MEGSAKKVPWLYFISADPTVKPIQVMLKPGEAPPERMNIKTQGFLLKEVGVENKVGIAIYQCIMEVI